MKLDALAVAVVGAILWLLWRASKPPAAVIAPQPMAPHAASMPPGTPVDITGAPYEPSLTGSIQPGPVTPPLVTPPAPTTQSPTEIKYL